MLPLTGSLVSVPLALMQGASLAHHTGQLGTVQDGGQLFLLNLLMAHAVYDADRARDVGDGPTRRAYFASTGAAALAASALLCLHESTVDFVPPLLALHAGYTESKAVLAPIKPFFVGAAWVAATTYLPLAFVGAGVLQDDPRPLCDAMQIAAWSHLADVDDIVEDAAKSIVTPAVALGETYAPLLSYALLTAACFASSGAWLDACSLTAFSLVDARRRRRRD
jgi:hypothetical protein